MSTSAPSFASTRRLQVVFLLLLSVALAQVIWWVFDQSRLADRLERETLEVWEIDRHAAERLIEAGLLAGPAGEALARELSTDFPHLEIDLATDGTGEGSVSIAEDSRRELAEERRSHRRQYLFEGGFFFLVILSAIAVLWRVLRKEHELWRRQENFLAAVSHELKSPLASLRLSQETLLRRELEPTARRELSERSLVDVGRLERLIGHLLETTRLEAGAVTLSPRALELRPLLEEVASQASGPLASVAIEVDAPQGATLQADPMAVRAVVRNLLDNAVVATEAAGSSEPVRLVGERRDGGVRIRVEDRGIGFESDEAVRLFEKFYRPGDELRRSHKGTGLGLYLVKRFVEAAGGRVEARSDGPGSGATFTLDWPDAAEGQAPAPTSIATAMAEERAR